MAKHPRVFYFDVPVQRENGTLAIDPVTGAVQTERRYGEYTCFHIAHRDKWKEHLHGMHLDEKSKKRKKK